MSKFIVIVVTVVFSALVIKPAYRIGQRIGMVICRFLDWREKRQLKRRADRMEKLLRRRSLA